MEEQTETTENTNIASTYATRINGTSATPTSSKAKTTEPSKQVAQTTKKVTKATQTRTTTASHQHSYGTSIVEAGCNEYGYTQYECVCGDYYLDNYVTPSHQYVEYVCTRCGEVDKYHAYDYLIEWTKSNGEYSNGVTSYSEMGGEYLYSISYDYSEDYLYISSSIYIGDELSYSSLQLDDHFYGVALMDQRIFGYLVPSEYTRSASLEYWKYQGPSAYEKNFASTARIAVGNLVGWLNLFLLEEELGITIDDLGYTAF